MTKKINQRILESIETKQRVLQDSETLANIEKVAQLIIRQTKAKHATYFAGNGGSAADAQHLAAELSGRFYFDRDPISAEALHCNTSFLTAVANDYSFDIVYARLLKALGREGDVLIGLSTSGNSSNIVAAMKQAKDLGIYTVALTGEGGGKMKELADISICIPSKDTPRIQEAHIMVGHIICEIVEETLFSNCK